MNSTSKNKPKYPIYIVSKGRHESRYTAKAFERMNVDYFIVVEASQYEDYCSVIAREKVLILPEEYLNNYETLDDLGRTKSVGPGAARNFCWDHSIANGHAWHWVFDDNMKDFFRLNKGKRLPVRSGAFFRAMEDFVDRYENIAQAGPNYLFFAKASQALPPFITNTRIYSALLIRNDIPFRWRGRYNEDTILSLDVLKAGWCTVQFNAFLCGKMRTQVLGGGNTEEFYKHEGTSPKSEMLARVHPDVARVVDKFQRVHHHVDYTGFQKRNRLIRKSDFDISTLPRVDNYQMKLIELSEAEHELDKAHGGGDADSEDFIND